MSIVESISRGFIRSFWRYSKREDSEGDFIGELMNKFILITLEKVFDVNITLLILKSSNENESKYNLRFTLSQNYQFKAG
jgi:hypothetical protein